MSSRAKILDQLRQKTRAVDHPGVWASRREYGDLPGRFMQALTAVYGEPHLTENLADATTKLSQILADLGAKRVLINDEAPLAGLNLPVRWPHITWHVVGQTGDDLRAFAAEADVGISGAAAALAETGSVIITSGPGRSRVATLFPPVHIVLLPTSAITADLFTFTAARQGNLPANLTFVSGPSKTADIEQTMAIGVHGPKRFIVILYQD